MKNFSKGVSGELTHDGGVAKTLWRGVRATSFPGSILRAWRSDLARPDPVTSPDPFDSTSQGMYWASRGLSVAMEFVIPAVFGLWVDRYWRLAPLGVIAGAIAGFAIGLFHLLRIVSESNRRSGSK